MKRIAVAALMVFGLGVTLVATEQPDAHAQAKQGAKKTSKKGAKGKKSKKDKEKEAEEAKKAKAGTSEGTGETAVKGAKATPAAADGTPKVVETKGGGDGGVKTYTFGPVAVEGRLKSPQIIYFLRRVRAEFAAGDLGHRSFMREMSDTRRHPALR